MRFFQIAFLFLACSVSYGQELIKVSPAETIRTTATIVTNRIMVGGVEISKEAKPGPDSAPVTYPIQLVTIDTKASNVRVTIEDANREDAKSAFIKLTDKQYASGKSGTYWFRVLAVDFAQNIFDESTVKVVVGSSPGPGPTPPPGPSVVPNEYNVGQLAYDLAPNDKGNQAKFGGVYRQAGQFLYGFPSFKFIQSTQNNTTDANVFVWIKLQVAGRVCTDPVECPKWDGWLSTIVDALRAEQVKRGAFTVLDWKNAFDEIATALEMKAKQ